MTRARLTRGGAIAAAVLLFVAVSLVVARWLAADGSERAKVEQLLRAQARGDAARMAKELSACDAACEARTQKLAARFDRGADADIEIVRYDSRTSHTLGAKTAVTRVVWQPTGGLTTVQCVLVRRTGSVLTGPRVTLLRLSEPIGREEPC